MGVSPDTDHGKSVRHVFETWRANGVLTVRGNKWSSVDRVAAMLRNPVLAGLVAHRGEIIGQGKWEPIVTPEERDRLGAAISPNATGARGYGQRRPRRHHLAGLVLCGNPECDLKPLTSHNPGSSRGYFYWTCDRRRGGCGIRVRSTDLDLPVHMTAMHFLMQTELADEAVPEFDDGPMRDIEQQIAEIRGALARRDMRASDAVPALRQLNADLAEQQAARDALEQTRRDTEEFDRALLATLPADLNDHDTRRAEDFLPVARQIAQAMAGPISDPAVVRALIDNVRVLPDDAGYVFEGRNGVVHMVTRNADGSLRGYSPED